MTIYSDYSMCQAKDTCTTHMNTCGQHTDCVTLVTMYQKLCTHGKSGTYSDQLCNVRIVLSWESCYNVLRIPLNTTQLHKVTLCCPHIFYESRVLSQFCLPINCNCYLTCVKPRCIKISAYYSISQHHC